MAQKDSTSPPSQRIAAFYKQLSASAGELNAVSDELGKSISALDAALKKLNLGISAWIEIAADTDERDGDFWNRRLGYEKVGGRWGIAISTSSGNYNFPEDVHHEEWLFNDSPRAFRVEAVDKLPELLEQLIKTADATTRKIKDKVTHAQELATAITDVARPSSQPTKGTGK
jgi:prefoldin subunit 5